MLGTRSYAASHIVLAKILMIHLTRSSSPGQLYIKAYCGDLLYAGSYYSMATTHKVKRTLEDMEIFQSHFCTKCLEHPEVVLKILAMRGSIG